MKAIEFKKQGILYFLHKFVFKSNPDDTCSYKGQLIIAGAIFLGTIHASILRTIFFLFRKHRNYKDNYGIGMHLFFFLVSFLGFVLGHSLTERIHKPLDFVHWHVLLENQEWIKLFLVTFLVMFMGLIFLGIITTGVILVVGSLYFIFKGLLWVWRKISPVVNPTYTNPYGEPETQLGIMYLSAKEKWCKRINWK